MRRAVCIVFIAIGMQCLAAYQVRGDGAAERLSCGELIRCADSLMGGQFESTGLEWYTTLGEGAEVDINFTMHAEVYYRLIVVSSESRQKVHYYLLDIDQNVLYDSQNYNDPSKWDFLLTSTMPVKLHLLGEKRTVRSPRVERVLVRLAFRKDDGAM